MKKPDCAEKAWFTYQWTGIRQGARADRVKIEAKLDA